MRSECRRHEAGTTLPDLLIALGLAGLLLLTATSIAVPWLARETARSGGYDVQAYLQAARAEAAARNRDCRFVIDPDSRTLQVLDTLGTGSTSDDAVLREMRVARTVSFARPDGTTAVTLPTVSGTSAHQAVFGSDGTVRGSAGAVTVFGGDRFVEVTLYLGGGIEVREWDGHAWTTGN